MAIILQYYKKKNKLLQDIDNWVNLNGLKLNVKKTKYMVFTNKRNIESARFNIRLNGIDIEITNFYETYS